MDINLNNFIIYILYQFNIKYNNPYKYPCYQLPMFKLFFMAALLIGALGVAVSSTAQQALADRVGPLGEDKFTQGGLGEFFAKQNRQFYYPDVTPGSEFGQVRSGYAQSAPGVIGANAGFYASGECHSTTQAQFCS
jgi:hypothetical protein